MHNLWETLVFTTDSSLIQEIPNNSVRKKSVGDFNQRIHKLLIEDRL